MKKGFVDKNLSIENNSFPAPKGGGLHNFILQKGQSNMKALAQQIVGRLVDNPKDVSIKEDRQDKIIKLFISVNPSDIGKVIGKEGKTITALRTLFKAISVKENRKLVDVTVAE